MTVSVFESCGARFLTVPVPPSTNARQFANRRLTREARNYLDHVSFAVYLAMKTRRIPTIKTFRHLDLWMVLPPRYDSHNALKVLLDMLERAKFVENDKMLLPRIQGVHYSGHSFKTEEVIINL